jgi:hypothetical protein
METKLTTDQEATPIIEGTDEEMTLSRISEYMQNLKAVGIEQDIVMMEVFDFARDSILERDEKCSLSEAKQKAVQLVKKVLEKEHVE